MNAATLTTSIADDTIREIIDDLGFDWYWAETYDWTPNGLTVTYWDDGERRYIPEDAVAVRGRTIHRHTSTATLQQLAHALAAIGSGAVTNDPYQVRAAVDYLVRSDEADGDYWTTDLVVQQAIFHAIVFG